MPSFNKIIIVGHLGREVDLKYTPQGTAVANFSIATSERRGDQETTTWFRITVFGKQAEIAGQYLKKGSLTYVEGRLKMTEYTDREGQKRTTLEVTADNFQMLERKPQDADNGSDAAFERKQAQGKAAFGAQAPAKQAKPLQVDDSWEPPF